jgi:tetratricopeptide (TPR) repeat protein
VAWHQLGKQYLEEKELQKALTAFDFAVISDDTFIGAYLEKAKVLERLNRHEEAIEHYSISMAIEGATAYTLLKIGYCYEQINKDDQALKFYMKSVEEDPAFDKGWMGISIFYFSKKDFFKSLFYVNKAIDIDDENADYWLFYSKINERLNYLEEAERGYKKTLELGNCSLETWLSRGDILIKLGELEAAKYNFVQALEHHPKSEELEFRISGICFKLNETETAYTHLLAALHYNAEHAFILEELFPDVNAQKEVQHFIKSYNKTSK